MGRRFDRSVNWVSRRLALVELRPEAIQPQVREGAIAAQLAMKYLVPVARVKAEHCARMAAAFVERRCDTRQAGPLYAAWRDGSRVVRERILAEPESFLKTQRQTPAIRPVAVVQERELEMEVAILHRARRRLTEATAGDGLSAAGTSAAPKWKARAANSIGRQRESERSGKPNMLSQAQRTAILELSAKGASEREIAHVLRMSRLSVRKALRSNLSKIPEIQRADKAEACQQQILDLLTSCKGNLVRVPAELTAGGAALSYPALTAFCRRQGIGQTPVVPAGQ